MGGLRTMVAPPGHRCKYLGERGTLAWGAHPAYDAALSPFTEDRT